MLDIIIVVMEEPECRKVKVKLKIIHIILKWKVEGNGVQLYSCFKCRSKNVNNKQTYYDLDQHGLFLIPLTKAIKMPKNFLLRNLLPC